MHENFLQTLQTHRAAICTRWDVLLRAEPASSPLANPDTLVHLMPWTLDHLATELRRPRLRRRPDSSLSPPVCPCGYNPLLRYFATAERALVETLFVNTRSLAELTPIVRETGLHELKLALARLAHGEIESFCAVCQRRNTAASTPASASAANPSSRPVAH